MKTNLNIPGKIYRVGGAVRDELLQYPSLETDYVVVGATPAEMLDAGFLPVGKSFPVFLHPKTKAEYALARSERKTAKGYHGFEFYTDPSVTLEEDLKRRDLTINAMAMDEKGNLYDPYGGKHDLDNKLLRHVSEAFVEDPVRILRIARFAARFAHLGFTVAPETLTLMKQMVEAGEVDALVAERVWKETEKAFEELNPEIYIGILRQCGALKILFPGLNAALDHDSLSRYHDLETICASTKEVESVEIPAIRYAVLAHDVHFINDMIPPHWQIYLTMLAENHEALNQLGTLDAAGLLDLLNSLDAFRRYMRFVGLLKIIAVLHGEGLAKHLKDACDIAAAVPIAPLTQGLTGIAIKEAIHHARIEAIAKSLAEKK
jgi:tRNA nucleotidyltransferase/poly(A) polymerase